MNLHATNAINPIVGAVAFLADVVGLADRNWPSSDGTINRHDISAALSGAQRLILKSIDKTQVPHSVAYLIERELAR
uniref:Uncharacterized protein n=1 Tax=Rhizobium rhizogenes TaxID=359 RepID=A0A7S4ZUN9_RHIRH|nr:hypothetical protein [Rhizobium rhizogenes]QCL10417.1 hypothetical protein pC6.5c_524 [Rhizobium rhizogenes]QCO89385.1 hypothetical protein pC5.7d_669 [Rhizobium rhizogenes]